MKRSPKTRLCRAGAVAVLALLLLALAVTIMPREQVQAYGEGTEVRRIALKLQCPVCQGQSVADSHSPVADGMRQKIEQMLAEGKSEKQIMDFFRSVYGDFVLRDPPKTGFASILWWGPGLGIIAGLATVYAVVRQRRRSQPAGGMGAPALVQSMPEEELQRYRQRLARELEDRGV